MKGIKTLVLLCIILWQSCLEATPRTELQNIYDLVVRYNASLEKGEDTDYIKDLIAAKVTEYNKKGPAKPLVVEEDEQHYYNMKNHVSIEW